MQAAQSRQSLQQQIMEQAQQEENELRKAEMMYNLDVINQQRRDQSNKAAMEKINGYLKKVQILETSNPDLYGGICGSYPLHGDYGKHEILNWAVKFFADALLLVNTGRSTPGI